MIGDIKTPWLRKPLVALACICLVLPYAISAAALHVFEWCDSQFDLRSAWRGPRGR